jgi:hypothetical protein
MAYETYRVEITRDETRPSGNVTIEITAYIDRVPETNDAGFERLTRASSGVWNSRLQYTGDFASLAAALAAIDAAHPEAMSIRCYEYSVDNEYPVEAALLLRSQGKWLPAGDPSP